jgi:hypothetical protein
VTFKDNRCRRRFCQETLALQQRQIVLSLTSSLFL